MMDLKEIIKWFIPCFHILRINKIGRTNIYLTFVCLFLISNTRPGYGAKVNSFSDTQISLNNLNKNDNYLIVENNSSTTNQSKYFSNNNADQRAITSDNFIGRTFGRPFKKMAAALIPLVFQMGAAATWAVVAALVGIKTLGVTLVILKLLLIAGAVKIGALFGNKGHHSSGWEPPPHAPQKEIHLHIHNGQHGHSGPEEHIPFSPWSREGTQSSADTKQINVVYEPYAGPQTISTPYGNYVKI